MRVVQWAVCAALWSVIICSVAGTATHPLTDIAGGQFRQVTVTSNNVLSPSVVLASCTGPATYNGVGAFAVTVVVTSVIEVSYAEFSLLSGNTYVAWGTTPDACTAGSCTLTFSGISLPRAGAYGAELWVYAGLTWKLYTAAQLAAVTGGWNGVNYQPASPPAVPSVVALSLGSTLGCTSNACSSPVAIDMTLTPANSYTSYSTFLTNAPDSGVVWMVRADHAHGVVNDTSGARYELTWQMGAQYGGAIFTAHEEENPVLPLGAEFHATFAAVVPLGNQAPGGTVVPLPTYSVTSTAGTADTTAPTCSAATFTSGSVFNGGTDQTSIAVAVTCTDGGVGVSIAGAIARYNNQGVITTDFTWSNSAVANEYDSSFRVYPFGNYTMDLIGVFAIDRAGNAVLYGTCGDLGVTSLCNGATYTTSAAATHTVSAAALLLGISATVLATLLT